MEAQIKTVIEEKINPMLATHGGSCEFVSLEANNVVNVKLKGACGGCPSAQITLKGFVLEVLRADIPEITDVESV